MEQNYNEPADTGYTAQDIENNKVMALLAYIIFFIPLLAARESKFAYYHANQGLVLFLTAIVLAIVSMILSTILAFIPIIGWIISILLGLAIWVFILVLVIIGIINAVNGRAKPLPLIGGIKILK